MINLSEVIKDRRNMVSKTMLFGAVFLVCAVWTKNSSGSAIPMWEYLGRGEKMSHLYTMFAKQVNAYCKTNTAEHTMKPQCKRDLLMHGLGNLNKMDDTQLDSMDPYQRGATDIMWDHMMDGHPMMEVKKETTTVAPIREPAGNFPRNPLFDRDTNEPQQKKPQTHEEYAMGMDSDPMNGHYQQAPKDQDNHYPEPQNHLYQETKVSEKYVNPLGVQSGYLGGPMMIMVRPDGTPIHSHMPRDDDQEAMLGRDKLPTMQQIAQSFGTTRNFLDENQNAASNVYPRHVTFRNMRSQPQKRSFFYRPSYSAYRSNQH